MSLKSGGPSDGGGGMGGKEPVCPYAGGRAEAGIPPGVPEYAYVLLLYCWFGIGNKGRAGAGMGAGGGGGGA